MAEQTAQQGAGDAAASAATGTPVVETTLPMTPQEAAYSLAEWAAELWQIAITPGWRQYQLVILLGLVALSFGLRLITEPRMSAWMRTLEGWPKPRLRMLVQIRRRLTLTWFVILSWSVYLIMQETTWPSRSRIIGIFATLALAWLVIAQLSRLVRNRSLRRIFRWTLWIYATLLALGLLDEVTTFLDAVSFSIGSLTISALAVIEALLSGAIGVGIGFGLQKVVSNLVSGIIILLDRSIKPGDVISLGDTFGWIHSLGARYVSVVTRDGREYLIPNEDLITGQVVNWTHSDEFVRLDIFFGTSYHDDPHQVRKLAIEAARQVPRVLSGKYDPVCHITGFGDSSVDYVLRFWIADPTGGLTNVRGNVFLKLWDTFHDNGISIPFPQREMRILNDPVAVTVRPDGN